MENVRGFFDRTAWSYPDDWGGVFTASPTAVSMRQERIDVVGLGSDHGLWHKAIEQGILVTDWAPLGMYTVNSPGAVVLNSQSFAVYYTPANVIPPGTPGMVLKRTYSGGSWGNSTRIANAICHSGPTVVATNSIYKGQKRIDLFCRFSATQIGHYWENGGFSGWELLPGFTGTPTAVATSATTFSLFDYEVSPYALRENKFALGAFGGWNTLTQTSTVGGVGVSSWGPGRIDLFGQLNNNFMHTWYDGGWVRNSAGAEFQAIEMNTSFYGERPAATSWGISRGDLFWVDPSSRHMMRAQYPNNQCEASIGAIAASRTPRIKSLLPQ
jgi:hypothetical protein